MRKTLILRILFWSLTVAIMLVIFFNSAKNATESSEVSNSFTDKLFSLFISDYDTMDETEKLSLVSSVQFVVRKSAHFLSYFAMGLFCFLAVNTNNQRLRNKFIVSSSICILYAVSDEIHQLFVPGRSGEIRDVLIDSGGILLAITVSSAIIVLNRKRKEKKHEKQSKSATEA